MIVTNTLVIRYDLTFTHWSVNRRRSNCLHYRSWEAAHDAWDRVIAASQIATATLWAVNPHGKRKRVYRMTRANSVNRAR